MARAMRAANAPDSPSGPDRVVASQAARIAAKARRELAAERAEPAASLRHDLGDGGGSIAGTDDDVGTVRPTRSRIDVVA